MRTPSFIVSTVVAALVACEKETRRRLTPLLRRALPPRLPTHCHLERHGLPLTADASGTTPLVPDRQRPPSCSTAALDTPAST